MQLFRLWLGATEFLFRQPGLLDETLKAAIEHHSFRSDDLEFTFAARVSLILFFPFFNQSFILPLTWTCQPVRLP